MHSAYVVRAHNIYLKRVFVCSFISVHFDEIFDVSDPFAMMLCLYKIRCMLPLPPLLLPEQPDAV